MGVISWLKSIFGKNKVEYKDLINISDIINIPTRETLKDNIEKIKLIDKYKDSYLEILSNKKIVTTLELDSNKLKKDIAMSVDLILHNIFTEQNISSLSNEELLIQKYKLNLYYNELNNIHTELITRLIALKELYDKRKVPRRNRMCLMEEINQLSNSLVIFLNQQVSIIKELKTFQTLLNISSKDIDSFLLDYRYNKLLFIASEIINKDELDKYSSIEEKIAYIETLLEKYAYWNKDKISKLRDELIELYSCSINRKNKDKLLEKIVGLEKKFLLFYDYGFNLINEDDINVLYETKFNILNCDIDFLRCTPICKDDYGFEYYKKIVFKKLECIILGKNDYFNYSISFNKDMIEVFKNSFKDKVNGEFDLDDILLDKYKLNLILCFDKKNGYKEMLANNEVYTNIDDKEKNYFEKFVNIPGIVWEDKIPLTSILKLICDKECEHPLYLMYKCGFVFEDFLDNCYKLPKGTKTIDGSLLPLNLKNKINMDSASKKIVFPDSLKSINGKFFGYTIIASSLDINILSEYSDQIILNDGLEVIGSSVFRGLKVDNITIPSSISKINSKTFEGTSLNSITFDDYKNSNILNNTDNLLVIFETFFKWEQYGEIEITEYNPKNAQQKKWIAKNDQDWIRDIVILKQHVRAGRKKKIVSNLKYIILKDKDIKIKIDLNELEVLQVFPYPYFSERLGYYDLGDLLKAFRSLILNKAGYDILEKENYEKRRN